MEREIRANQPHHLDKYRRVGFPSRGDDAYVGLHELPMIVDMIVYLVILEVAFCIRLLFDFVKQGT